MPPWRKRAPRPLVRPFAPSQFPRTSKATRFVVGPELLRFEIAYTINGTKTKIPEHGAVVLISGDDQHSKIALLRLCVFVCLAGSQNG